MHYWLINLVVLSIIGQCIVGSYPVLLYCWVFLMLLGCHFRVLGWVWVTRIDVCSWCCWLFGVVFGVSGSWVYGILCVVAYCILLGASWCYWVIQDV